MPATTKTILSTIDVAAMTGVTDKTAAAWIDRKLLKGYRIPGSKHRRVLLSDLIAFAKKHKMPLFMAAVK